ncbi:unnamed protein product [Owenia fusiformis]|uniref:Uncharacterized protein n=1 Tax=Owenia fusiformis TaxID=6347 RepID=A0A8J1Y9B4_OWEFU|nr:unnamed protein product [Owenia fusiformis]
MKPFNVKAMSWLSFWYTFIVTVTTLVFLYTLCTNRRMKRQKPQIRDLQSNELTANNTPCESLGRKLPQCIIIGVQKCGTSALSDFMAVHPQLIRSVHAEEHFFDKFLNHNVSLKDEIILKYMPNMPLTCDHEIAFEKTPAYFDGADPRDLLKMNPALRLILLICDPVRRALSAYLHNVNIGKYPPRPYTSFCFTQNGDVNETSDIISRGRYDIPLMRYLNIFPRRQLLILDQVTLEMNPLDIMKRIESFLQLDEFYDKSTFYFNTTVQYFCINPKLKSTNSGCLLTMKYRSHPNLSEKHTSKLQQYFKPFNYRFMDIAQEEFTSLQYLK